ncbi:MAG: GFA family protein [Desulfobacteraceae bacterium]|nr:MAG: GFA family protein [Desulfobacteraceae bacterium]
MKKTYAGSCQCGAVRFESDIDLAEGTSKCNCSICTKTRNWKAIVKADAFRLLEGDDALTDYPHGGVHHFFCNRCGVHPFGRGRMEELGSDFYAISVVCLDNAALEELVKAPVSYQDGRNENWESAPDETRHL